MRPQCHHLPSRVPQCFDKPQDRILLAPRQGARAATDCRISVARAGQDQVDQPAHSGHVARCFTFKEFQPLDAIFPIEPTTALRGRAIIRRRLMLVNIEKQKMMNILSLSYSASFKNGAMNDYRQTVEGVVPVVAILLSK